MSISGPWWTGIRPLLSLELIRIPSWLNTQLTSFPSPYSQTHPSGVWPCQFGQSNSMPSVVNSNRAMSTWHISIDSQSKNWLCVSVELGLNWPVSSSTLKQQPRLRHNHASHHSWLSRPNHRFLVSQCTESCTTGLLLPYQHIISSHEMSCLARHDEPYLWSLIKTTGPYVI